MRGHAKSLLGIRCRTSGYYFYFSYSHPIMIILYCAEFLSRGMAKNDFTCPRTHSQPHHLYVLIQIFYYNIMPPVMITINTITNDVYIEPPPIK